MYGPEEANALVLRVWPKPISERWGNTSICEKRLLSCDALHFKHALGATLNKVSYFKDYEANLATARAVGGGPAEFDAMRADSSATYSENLGKWAKHAYMVIQDLRWYIMETSHLS